MLDGRRLDERNFMAGEPSAMTEVGFLIVAEEILIKKEAANGLNQLAPKHEASPFGTEDGVIALIFWTVRLVKTVVIGQPKPSQKRTADIQCIPETRE